jgi:signal transduction histidine kinase
MAFAEARPPAGQPPLRRARVTFATRLLIGGLTISLGIIVTITTFLLISRQAQTRSVALTNSESRAQALRELVEGVTVPHAEFDATSIAALHSLKDALSAPDPGKVVSGLFTGPAPVGSPGPGDTLAIFDGKGKLLTTAGARLPDALTSRLGSVGAALQGTPNQGPELQPSGLATYDFAIPIRDAGGITIGVLLYLSPIESQIDAILPAVGIEGNDGLWVANSTAASVVRIHESRDPKDPTGIRVATDRTSMPVPASWNGLASNGSAGQIGGFYTSSDGDVVATLYPMATTLNPGHPVVFIGVESQLAPFVGPQNQDIATLLLLAGSLALITVLAVLLFVHRFVRRPVARLSEGVTRIADGDYTHDVPVTSQDELGVLAMQVNRMRAQIQTYIDHIDGAVRRLSEVSQALTTTTAGIGSLESAVCSAAAAIAGGGGAHLMARDDAALVSRATNIRGASPPDLSADELASLLRGETVVRAEPIHLVAVPMPYQEQVRGALMVVTPEALGDADRRALTALANNAAIALENTRLFEREKQTVQRLRELDAMKSDFLSTAQHELRTPVTAIMGQLELIRLVWPQVEDSQKLGIIDDIEISTRMLRELLETIIDFSLVGGEKLLLRWTDLDAAKAITGAVEDITKHYRDGEMPVTLDTRVPGGVHLAADPERFRQVMRSLLDNAVKFTPKGGRVVVSARQDGNACVIDVVDTGIGIDPSMHQRIFERFFQVDNTGTRSYGGMGMGLALARALCEAHGGKVTVESELEKGSRFTLRWPATRPQSAQPSKSADTFHLASSTA